MRIVTAGGHGQVAMLLHPLLAERGHQSVGLIRDEAQGEELRQVGAVPRADVAAVVAEVLATPETAGLQLELTAGELSVAEAVARAVREKGV